MGIDVCCSREVAVAQPLLDFFHGHPVFQQQTGTSMPLWHNKDKSENPCVATGWLVCPYSFSTKNGPEMGATGGGEKPGLHLKDKFFQIMKEGKMGAWGITERESDAGYAIAYR